VQKLSQVIHINEGKIQAHLDEVVPSTVEETLNALLDAEADRSGESKTPAERVLELARPSEPVRNLS
jgi:hypothetical protein